MTLKRRFARKKRTRNDGGNEDSDGVSAGDLFIVTVIPNFQA